MTGVLWVSAYKYKADASSTYKLVNSSFLITYDSNASNSGDYIQESVSFAGSQSVTLPNVDMGLSLTAGPTTNGLMGVVSPNCILATLLSTQ